MIKVVEKAHGVGSVTCESHSLCADINILRSQGQRLLPVEGEELGSGKQEELSNKKL